MMGVSAGTADAIGQLKEILELASDPKKLAKALAELEKASAETKALLEEKAKVEMEAAAKLKKLETSLVDYDDKMAKLRALDAEVNSKHQVYLSNSSGLKTREQNLERGQKALDAEKADHVSAVADYTAKCVKMDALISEKLAEAKALKEEYEARLLKLKQAMG